MDKWSNQPSGIDDEEYADAAKFRGQNGWTKEGWKNMVTRLNSKYPGFNFIVSQLKDREQSLKKEHSVVKSILEKSGFGWDPEKRVPTVPDEKWNELSKEQQKWRYRAFPYYDDLYEIYEGKTADGKRCKRTTDRLGEKYNMPFFPENGSLYEQVLSAATMESPNPSIPAPGSAVPDYDLENDLYGSNDISYAQYSEPPETTQNHISTEENQTHLESPPRKKTKHTKVIDEGGDKTKAKKSKDVMLENLVSIRKEEPETYKELKTKQIESYKEIKFAQIEKNDPSNDPYCMARCIDYLKQLALLTPSKTLKVINYLKKDRVNREVFMTVDHDVVVELLKEVVSSQVGSVN